MGSINGVWHDNQTWLVLLGGMLFGAFPLFYSLVLSSLYIPILFMLFGLIFRGVAFEFRSRSRRKRLWSMSFGLGSLIVAVAQGLALGGLLGGPRIENDVFTGSVWGWMNSYSLLIAAGVTAGYVMLGANFLILKTAGEIQRRAYRHSFAASIVTLFISIAVHSWTVAKYPHMARKWQTTPDVWYVAAFLFLAGFSFAMYLRSLRRRREAAPLLWNVAVVLFSFIGLSVGMYPYMIPNLVDPLSVEKVAASRDTLFFMLVVTLVLLPVILSYTGYKYRLFRGKTTEHDYGETVNESLKP